MPSSSNGPDRCAGCPRGCRDKRSVLFEFRLIVPGGGLNFQRKVVRELEALGTKNLPRADLEDAIRWPLFRRKFGEQGYHIISEGQTHSSYTRLGDKIGVSVCEEN